MWQAFAAGDKTLGWRVLRAVGLSAILCLSAAPAVPQEATTAAVVPAAAAPAADTVSPTLRPYVPPQTPASASASATSSAPPRPRPRPAVTSSSAAPPVAASQASAVAARPSTPPATVTPAPVTSAATTPLATPAGTAVVSRPISAEDIETFTDATVRALMQRDHVLGVSVAVVQGNTPLLVKGYGFDRLAPARRVDPDTSMFRVGSVTKVFTWIVARQEIEAGRIRLDTPVGEHLPPEIYVEDGRYKPLTLRHLMSHTGGFEDKGLGHLFQLNGARLVGPGRYRSGRVREPGRFSTYSNYGAALAALALRDTAKAQDVPSLMEARIFQPLGMTHTTLREPYAAQEGLDLPAPMAAALTPSLSDGFIWDGASWRTQPFDHAIALSGALSASSSARDMAKLMGVMLSGGQGDGIALYNAESSAAFRTPMLTTPEGYNGWASGLMIRSAPAGAVTYGHSGSTLWFNTRLVVVPEMNLGIFISTNTQSGAALAEAYPDLLLDHLAGVAVRPPLMPAPNQTYAQNKAYYDSLSGHYVATRRAYGGLEGFITRLIHTVRISADTDGRLIMTGPSGVSAYVPASAQGFFLPQDSEDAGPGGSAGGLHFLFKRDDGRDSRKAVAIETTHNMLRYERVGWYHKPGTLNLLSFGMIVTCLLVWISLARGLSRYERPTEEQARATLVSAGLSLVWLCAIFTFAGWQSHLADDPVQLFTRWPSGQVQLASWLVLIAAGGTIYQIITSFFVFTDRQSFSVSEGWALWQKIAHGLLLGYWAVYIIVLTLWGAINPLA